MKKAVICRSISLMKPLHNGGNIRCRRKMKISIHVFRYDSCVVWHFTLLQGLFWLNDKWHWNCLRRQLLTRFFSYRILSIEKSKIFSFTIKSNPYVRRDASLNVAFFLSDKELIFVFSENLDIFQGINF